MKCLHFARELDADDCLVLEGDFAETKLRHPALARLAEDLANPHEKPGDLAVRIIMTREWETCAHCVRPLTAPCPLIARPFVWRDPATIKPREWIYGGHYIRKFLSVTVAPGGMGKSSHALVEAVEMVSGKALLLGKPGPRRRVAYWNGEDPLEETARRVAAICLHYGLTADDLGDRLFIQSGRESPIVMATESREGVAIAKPVTAALIQEAQENELDVLIVDPFVKAHAVSENDNGKVDAVATQFAEIADAANLSVELIHHLRKASGAGQDRTADDARGASALISAARSVRVLNPMQTAEAESLGIAEDQRRRFFRVDDGKANLMPPSDRAVWRRLASVGLGNSQVGLAEDNVQVAEVWEKPAPDAWITAEHIAEIQRRLDTGAPNRRSSQSPEWVGTWVAEMFGIDLTLSGSRKRVAKMIEALIGQRALSVASDSNGKGRAVEIITATATRSYLQDHLADPTPEHPSRCGEVWGGVAAPCPGTPPHPTT